MIIALVILSVGIKSCKIDCTVIKILYFVLKGKKQHMGKLIILRGNSGSGKTTVAKALQKKLGRNTMLISQDEVRRNMLWVDDGIDTKALPLMAELLRYGREHSEFSILEGIMYDEWYRSLFELANELYVQMYTHIILICRLKKP